MTILMVLLQLAFFASFVGLMLFSENINRQQ
jgi:hypothetical protein